MTTGKERGQKSGGVTTKLQKAKPMGFIEFI